MSDRGDPGDPGPRGAPGSRGKDSPPEGEGPPSPPGWPTWTPQNPPRGWPAWSPPSWNPEDLTSSQSSPSGEPERGVGAGPGSAAPPAAPAESGLGAAGVQPSASPAGEPGTEPDDLPLEEAFVTVWTAPRATIRRIVARDPAYWVLPLAAVGGITQVLASVARRGEPDVSLGTILLTAAIAGPIFGVVALYLGAWLTRLTGRWWLNGRAAPRELRTALGWASLPHVAALPLWLLGVALFGRALFTDSALELLSRSWLYAFFVLAGLMLQLWGLVIAAAGVAEVQGYRSAWKGLWNLVLVALLVLLSAVALALVLGVVAALLGGLLR